MLLIFSAFEQSNNNSQNEVALRCIKCAQNKEETHMKKSRMFLALALVVVSVLAISLPAMAVIYGYVNVPADEYLNIRDIPESYGDVVCRLHRGDRVEIVTAYQSGWTKIIVDGYEDQPTYCMSEFLSQYPPTPGWQERYGTETLRYDPNTFNSYVVNLQRDLYSAGYTSVTNADGYFGTITETAVKNFQRNNGLTADGLVGDRTKQALWDKLHP